MKKYKIHLIVGARPNFMKMAPLYTEFMKYEALFDVKLVHTGQHYDEKMSNLFFDDLGLPKPDAFLEVGSDSHARQTAKIMERYEEYLLSDSPDHVIVCGDVNSTIACALVAVKLSLPVSHVEAGLRSYDRKMPEEINRILTDAISDFLFIPSLDARENLLAEGIKEDKIHFVGNIMIDSLVNNLEEIKNFSQLPIPNSQLRYNYALATLHRPSNVDTFNGLNTILNAFIEIAKDIKLIFPVHPRTRKNIETYGFSNLLNQHKNIVLLEPLGYLDFMKLEKNAKFILTDSGGVQEETTYFGIPCLTLRNTTERPITISIGTNKLVALKTESIIKEAREILAGNAKKGSIPPLWDGKTAERIVKVFKDKKL